MFSARIARFDISVIKNEKRKQGDETRLKELPCFNHEKKDEDEKEHDLVYFPLLVLPFSTCLTPIMSCRVISPSSLNIISAFTRASRPNPRIPIDLRVDQSNGIALSAIGDWELARRVRVVIMTIRNKRQDPGEVSQIRIRESRHRKFIAIERTS